MYKTPNSTGSKATKPSANRGANMQSVDKKSPSKCKVMYGLAHRRLTGVWIFIRQSCVLAWKKSLVFFKGGKLKVVLHKIQQRLKLLKAQFRKYYATGVDDCRKFVKTCSKHKFYQSTHKNLKKLPARFKQQLLKLRRANKPSYVLVAVVVIMAVLLVVIVSGGDSKDSNDFHKLQNKIIFLENQLHSKVSLSDKASVGLAHKVKALEQQLHDIAKTNQQLSTMDINKLRVSIKNGNTSLTNKLQTLGKKLAKLDQAIKPELQQSPKTLPFAVHYIDMWNARPYVEISPKSDTSKISYLGLYDRVGDWKVAHLNADEQTVSFVNHKNMLVDVHIKQF